MFIYYIKFIFYLIKPYVKNTGKKPKVLFPVFIKAKFGGF